MYINKQPVVIALLIAHMEIMEEVPIKHEFFIPAMMDCTTLEKIDASMIRLKIHDLTQVFFTYNDVTKFTVLHLGTQPDFPLMNFKALVEYFGKRAYMKNSQGNTALDLILDSTELFGPQYLDLFMSKADVLFANDPKAGRDVLLRRLKYRYKSLRIR